jgi:flagellum-specific ATP synthase
MAAFRDKRDLIAIGAYERGTDPLTDRAIDLRADIDDFLRQRVDEPTPAEDADQRLLALVNGPGAETVDGFAVEEHAGPATAQAAPFSDSGLAAIPPLQLGVR